jgi:hypothetical protein
MAVNANVANNIFIIATTTEKRAKTHISVLAMENTS